MSDRPITLFLIDDDPIFRLGLATALSAIEDLQILHQGETKNLFKQLRERIPNIVVLEPDARGWQLAQKLKQEYPQVKICLLCQSLSPQELLAAKKSGIEGYCPKGKKIDELVRVFREIASGATYWEYLTTLCYSRYQNYSPQRRWSIRLFHSGIAQIEQNLTLVNSQLNQPQLSRLDWLFWTGRRRELLTSRWIVRQLMPVETVLLPEESQAQPIPNNPSDNLPIPIAQSVILPIVSSSSLQVPDPSPLTVSNLLEETLNKIQFGVENSTNIPLEIDILQPQKRRELLYLIYSQIHKLVTEFPLLDITSEQLKERLSLILVKIWEESTRLFIQIYYPNKKILLEGLIEEILEGEILSVKRDILNKIPLVYQLFSYLLFKENMLVQKVEYRANSPEAIERAGILLENLLSQIANGVMAVMLNNFSDNEMMKKTLYKNEMRSSRNIAKFRNKISLKYREEKYWEDPKDIFESQYRLFYFKKGKISKIFIEYPRSEELNQLMGIPWAVTILLEIRDAITPGVRAIIAIAGQGLVYVLTSIIGKGIGLIGRGIIQGIGNALQETRSRKNSQQSK